MHYDDGVLRSSEVNSINSDTRVRSLLSNIARQNYEYVNSQPIEAHLGSMQHEKHEPPQSVQENYSPRFKHMPIQLSKNMKGSSAAAFHALN